MVNLTCSHHPSKLLSTSSQQQSSQNNNQPKPKPKPTHHLPSLPPPSLPSPQASSNPLPHYSKEKMFNSSFDFEKNFFISQGPSLNSSIYSTTFKNSLQSPQSFHPPAPTPSEALAEKLLERLTREQERIKLECKSLNCQIENFLSS